jgi:hypothetical protein
MRVSAKQAVSFLVSRIAEQARADSVPLSRTELHQLSFSEETASDSEIAAAAEFDANNDATLFEAKVRELLHRAFERDVENGTRALWEVHLAALANEDVYVQVMVDEAGIPRPKPTIGVFLPKSTTQFTALLRHAVVWTLPLAGAFYFIILPMRWGKQPEDPYMFGSLVDRLHLSEGLKGAFFIVWIAASVFLLYYRPNSKR